MENAAETLCNLCGLPCTAGIPGKTCPEGHQDFRAGLIDAGVAGGFESTPGNGDGALDDTVAHRFSLCEWCLDWLFAQFKIPVGVSSDTPGDDWQPPPWRPASERVRTDEWRRMKDVFQAEYERRALARSTGTNRT